MFTKDPVRYRYLPGSRRVDTPNADGEIVDRRELVFAPFVSGPDPAMRAWVEEDFCRPGEVATKHRVVSDSEVLFRFAGGSDEAIFQVAPLLGAIVDGELRGRYELDAVAALFWRFMVLAPEGRAHLARFFPDLDAFYARHERMVAEQGESDVPRVVATCGRGHQASLF